MAGWLSDEWVAEATGAGPIFPPDLEATYQVTVSGSPSGEFRYHRRVEGGRVAAAAVGAAPGSDVSLTLTYDDASAIRDGSLDPSVAFMQGRLKSTGSPGMVLVLLAAWSSPAGRKALAGGAG